MAISSIKLTKKDRIRLINQYIIERKSDLEIQKIIYETTGNTISTRTLRRDKVKLRKDATTFFFLLAKDNDQYNHKLKITIDSMEQTMADLKREYNQVTEIYTKLKISEQLLKYEKEIYEYYKFLPMLNSGVEGGRDSATTETNPIEQSTVF